MYVCSCVVVERRTQNYLFRIVDTNDNKFITDAETIHFSGIKFVRLCLKINLK